MGEEFSVSSKRSNPSTISLSVWRSCRGTAPAGSPRLSTRADHRLGGRSCGNFFTVQFGITLHNSDAKGSGRRAFCEGAVRPWGGRDRLAGVTAIIGGCAVLALLILAKINQRAVR